jgi:WD40 repeat protein
MIALLRPLFSVWAAFLVALLIFRLLGTLPPCLCFAYSAPPAAYGLTELRLWDARTGISLSLADAPFIGDVLAPQSRHYIAYSLGTALALLETNGQLHLLDFPNGGVSAPHFSPDGNYLVHNVAPRSGEGLYLREINSTEQHRIAPFPLSVTWSPDSQSLLYSIRNRRLNRFELYQLSINNEESRLLATNDRGFFDMDWSPDGQSLLFVKERQLWRYDFSTQSSYPLEITELSRMPRWSADSRRYAFQIRRPDGLYLRIVEVYGSTVTLANNSINPAHAFVWWQPQ